MCVLGNAWIDCIVSDSVGWSAMVRKWFGRRIRIAIRGVFERCEKCVTIICRYVSVCLGMSRYGSADVSELHFEVCLKGAKRVGQISFGIVHDRSGSFGKNLSGPTFDQSSTDFRLICAHLEGSARFRRGSPVTIV